MNTFKKGDVVDCHSERFTVKYIDGPYVYGRIGPHAAHHTDCTLVSEATRGDILATALDKKPKFRVGDRVRTSSVKDAGIGTILGPVDGSLTAWSVKFDTWYGVCGEEESRLTLVAPSIVALFESGVYKPSNRPVVHATKEAAIAEAERLARKHPGSEFATFTIAARTTSNKPTVTTVSV